MKRKKHEKKRHEKRKKHKHDDKEHDNHEKFPYHYPYADEPPVTQLL